jgi:hypothetical protein
VFFDCSAAGNYCGSDGRKEDGSSHIYTVNQVYPTKIRKGLENRYRNISHIAAFVVKVVGRTGDLLKKAKKKLGIFSE